MVAKKKVIADVVLVATFLCIALVLVLVMNSRKRTGAFAVVAVNGQTIELYGLETDGTYVLNGGTNTLVISNGTARLIDADCPDKLCVKQGVVRYSGQCITCLPNRLTVTIEGGDNSVDFVM